MPGPLKAILFRAFAFLILSIYPPRKTPDQ
jgi:hypothetical protein